ncbi:MAG: transcription elongation factor GreA [Thermodesulfobacteriota bacterium]|nr:MAG: transcription elongation factor GreA [Thermodesulfobacteriota bacterium]
MKELPIVQELRDELQKVERELRLEVPKELQTAAAHGDFRENSEYDAAKQRQSYLHARAAQLHERINSLISIKLDKIPRDSVGFGSRVSLEDTDTGESVTYELVTPEEVDPKNGKISIGSPVGKALLGKTPGEEVIINLPTGTMEYELTELVTIHEIFSGKKGE